MQCYCYIEFCAWRLSTNDEMYIVGQRLMMKSNRSMSDKWFPRERVLMGMTTILMPWSASICEVVTLFILLVNYIISCGIGIKSTTIIASDWLHFQFVLLNDVHCVHEVLLTRISAEKGACLSKLLWDRMWISSCSNSMVWKTLWEALLWSSEQYVVVCTIKTCDQVMIGAWVQEFFLKYNKICIAIFL